MLKLHDFCNRASWKPFHRRHHSTPIPPRNPWSTPPIGWWEVLKRTWFAANDNNVTLIAAGTAFYAFSSIAPILAAAVLTYGLVATPETVTANIQSLFAVLPDDIARLISEQLVGVATTSKGKQGFGLIIALLLAVYGGSKSATSMMTALNITVNAKETRGIVKFYLTAFAIVIGGVLLMVAGATTSTVTAFINSLLPWMPTFVKSLIGLSSYLLLAAIGLTGMAALFRFAPDVKEGRFRWGSPGGVVATTLWLGVTTGFGFYVANFGDYGATYGSLSAIVVLLTWLWLSVLIVLLGAELDTQLARAREPAPETAEAG